MSLKSLLALTNLYHVRCSLTSMSSEDTGSDVSPGPADVTWPRRALARLALSSAAAQLADRATGMVPTTGDEWSSGAEHVDQAVQLLDAAREVLDRAVVYARERGASWADVGEALGGMTRQSAHERHAATFAEWEAGLDEPWIRHGTVVSPRLPDGAGDPDRTATRLDQWCTAHLTEEAGATRHDAERADVRDRMVSAHLPRHTETTESASLLRQLNHLTALGTAATAAQREHYAARKQAVLRALDDDQSDD